MSLIAESAYIGPQVTLGENVKIGPGAVILGPATIGDNVFIGPGAQIGAPPEISSLEQTAAWANAGELQGAGVIIEDRAVIRENAVVHQGSHRPTIIGTNSWILNRAYLAHDVQVGAATTISAGVSIGGHCTIGARVNIGMNAVIHQRRVIANGAMIGMGTPLTADVPPFAKVYGAPPRLHAINSVGLERAGYSAKVSAQLEAAYREADLLSLAESLPVSLVDLAQEFSLWQADIVAKAVKVS